MKVRGCWPDSTARVCAFVPLACRLRAMTNACRAVSACVGRTGVCGDRKPRWNSEELPVEGVAATLRCGGAHGVPPSHRRVLRRAAAWQVVVAEGGLKKEESEFNAEFTKHLLTKLDWAALASTAAEVRGSCAVTHGGGGS